MCISRNKSVPKARALAGVGVALLAGAALAGCARPSEITDAMAPTGTMVGAPAPNAG